MVECGPDQHDTAGGEGGGFAVFGETEESEKEKHGAEAAKAVEVKRTPADTPGHEKPCTEDTSHVDAVLAESEVVSVGVRETGLLKEIAGNC